MRRNRRSRASGSGESPASRATWSRNAWSDVGIVSTCGAEGVGPTSGGSTTSVLAECVRPCGVHEIRVVVGHLGRSMVAHKTGNRWDTPHLQLQRLHDVGSLCVPGL